MKKVLVVSAMILGLSLGAFAQKAEAGWSLDQSVKAGYNPLGAALVTKLGYTLPTAFADGPLFESGKLVLGFQNTLSPAYDYAGVYAEFSPAAFFEIDASVQAMGFFKAIGFGFYDMNSYNGDLTGQFDDNAFKNLTAKDAVGLNASVTPTLKLAVGPVVGINAFTLSYFWVDGGAGYFYERGLSAPLAKNDIQLNNSAYLLYTISSGIYAGLNDSWTIIPATGYSQNLLSAIGIYSTKINAGLQFYCALTAGSYLTDRYLQGLRVGGQAGVTVKL